MDVKARLAGDAARLAATPLRDLVAADPARARDFALRVGPMYVNFARQAFDRAALDVLFGLATEQDVPGAFSRMLAGERVNTTEDRAALHTALRGVAGAARDAVAAMDDAAAVRTRMHALVRELHGAGIRDVVSLGIGGSDLGPRMVVDALGHADGAPRVHFVSNVDAHAIARLLPTLDPATTALVVISKSFGTQETLLNASVARAWLGDGGARTYAVTANPARAEAIGIAPERILPMWDWVGGRYSLWSAVGFPIALAIGSARFDALLDGAARFDRHCADAPMRDNPALWHALTAVWNRNALDLPTHAVLAYDERLRLLPAYLQQLVMESLGKTAASAGGVVVGDTVPVWWGGAGTDVQHSFFQMLHQGTQVVPADFIGVLHADHAHAENHAVLLANLFAQAEALANGSASDDPHRNYPGGRPSTMILLDALTPDALGMMVAFYEHSVHAQSVLWGINAFDQFGVELGKQLANGLAPAIAGTAQPDDPVSRALVAELHARR